MKIAIVGLGLMGGSLGLALQKAEFISKIYGYDRNQKHKDEALKLGLIKSLCTEDELLNMDIIVLAIPVDGIISTLNKLQNVDKNCTIIDFGSTKSKIIHNCPKNIRKNLVASHPMTGTEKSGPTASLEKLYENKIMVICDPLDSGQFQREVSEKIFNFINANIVYMESKDHDIHASFISHLPHIISFSLANSVMKQENPSDILTLAAGGFKDMSRIAKSNPYMWKDIFRQNRDNLLKSIEEFQAELDKSKKMLKDENWEDLSLWMTDANKLHDIL
jgi:prephenate dehydrogenase